MIRVSGSSVAEGQGRRRRTNGFENHIALLQGYRRGRVAHDGQESDALVAGAVEAEADPDRHVMEEAVLATVAKHGLDAKDLWNGFNSLTWSRADHGALADAIWACVVDRTPADLVLIRAKLKDAGARVEDNVLTGILDGSKVRDPAVALCYIGIMERQDRFSRAAVAGLEYMAKVESAKAEGGDVDAAVAGLLKDTFALAAGKRLVREYPKNGRFFGFLKTLESRRTDGRAGRAWTPGSVI